MMRRIPGPRLLPVTIFALAIVLATKSAILVRFAATALDPSALVTTAWAGGADAPPAKPAAKPAQQKPAEPVSADEKPPVPEGPPPVSDSERAVLLELRQRRLQLDAREATIAARESMLAAAEIKLSSRVQELRDLQKKLEGLDASHREQQDAAWKGLVKVYETMKPRDAATIFNDLGMQVLLSVVDRMKETKAAAILAAMAPDKARDLTTQLALFRTRGGAVTQTGDKPMIPPGAGIPPGPVKAPGSGT